jgi:hypothetical protein
MLKHSDRRTSSLPPFVSVREKEKEKEKEKIDRLSKVKKLKTNIQKTKSLTTFSFC